MSRYTAEESDAEGWVYVLDDGVVIARAKAMASAKRIVAALEESGRLAEALKLLRDASFRHYDGSALWERIRWFVTRQEGR